MAHPILERQKQMYKEIEEFNSFLQGLKVGDIGTYKGIDYMVYSADFTYSDNTFICYWVKSEKGKLVQGLSHLKY